MMLKEENVDELAMRISCSIVTELGNACTEIVARHAKRYKLPTSIVDRIMTQVFLSFLVGSYFESEAHDQGRSLDDLLEHVTAGWCALAAAHEGLTGEGFVQ